VSEPNVYEQLAGMTIERDAALAKVARVESLVDTWDRRAGEDSEAERVWPGQKLSVQFVVNSVRAELR